MANPKAAVLVIGDEILSGRTRDANMFHLAGKLAKVGIDLAEARIVADNTAGIIAATNTLRGRYDYVFTSGGIGPTHDDITADSIAAAFDVSIDIREDALELLARNYPNGVADLTQARLRMARIPDGAGLIENTVSWAPGFYLENVYVLAGVPKVFTAMLDSVLPKLKGGMVLVSESVRVNQQESTIAIPLERIAMRYPLVSIGSYPFHEGGIYGSNIVIRANDASLVAQVRGEVEMMFDGE